MKSCRQTCHGSPVGRKLGGSAYQTPFSGGSDDEESAGKAGGPGLLPGSGRFPGEGHGSPLQHPCLEDPMDRGACWATGHGAASFRTGRMVRGKDRVGSPGRTANLRTKRQSTRPALAEAGRGARAPCESGASIASPPCLTGPAAEGSEDAADPSSTCSHLQQLSSGLSHPTAASCTLLTPG